MNAAIFATTFCEQVNTLSLIEYLHSKYIMCELFIDTEPQRLCLLRLNRSSSGGTRPTPYLFDTGIFMLAMAFGTLTATTTAATTAAATTAKTTVATTSTSSTTTVRASKRSRNKT